MGSLFLPHLTEGGTHLVLSASSAPSAGPAHSRCSANAGRGTHESCCAVWVLRSHFSPFQNYDVWWAGGLSPRPQGASHGGPIADALPGVTPSLDSACVCPSQPLPHSLCAASSTYGNRCDCTQSLNGLCSDQSAWGLTCLRVPTLTLTRPRYWWEVSMGDGGWGTDNCAVPHECLRSWLPDNDLDATPAVCRVDWMLCLQSLSVILEFLPPSRVRESCRRTVQEGHRAPLLKFATFFELSLIMTNCS